MLTAKLIDVSDETVVNYDCLKRQWLVLCFRLYTVPQKKNKRHLICYQNLG